MATHSNILAWEIPWTEKPGRLQYSPWGHKESDTTERLSAHSHIHMCVSMVHFAVHLKPAPHWQSTIL